MIPRNQIPLLLSCAGMEIIWRYAWVFFLTLSILGRPVSLLEPTVIFTFAYLVTMVTNSNPWRLYRSLSLHILGFSFLWVLTIYRFFYTEVPALGTVWIEDWFFHLKELQFFIIQLLFFLCLLSFWLGARAMVKREHGYFSVCLQFDKGLGLLFLLLLVKFVAEQKGGLLIEEKMTHYLIFAYFTFSMVAISLAGDQNRINRTFRSGYHGMGIILGFLTFILIACAFLTSLFLPAITLMADTAHSTLKDTFEPMVPVFVRAIRYLFSMGRYRREIGTRLSDGSEYQSAPGDEMAWCVHGYGGMITGLIGLIALVLCGYLVRLSVRWLLKRSTGNESYFSLSDFIHGLLSAMTATLFRFWYGFSSLLKKSDSASTVYSKLLRWGRRSGLSATLTETPREYGCRLSQQLPELKAEIEIIIEAFNKEAYGNIEIDGRMLSRILSALRSMQSPRYWRSRIRGWFARAP